MAKTLSVSCVGLLLAMSGAAAEERLELNNIYPLTQEYFQLAESVFFTQDNRGFFEVVDGPFEAGPARCIGSGFGYRDGRNTISGICIFGEDADTFTMAWEAGEQGAANEWKIVGATGRYEGMTGSGIATTDTEIMYKAMPLRQTHIVGTVDIPD